MEVSEINMISNFEAGMNCLQNPSSISRFFSLSGIEKLPHVYSTRFWKWGALIFAIFATLNSVIKRLIKPFLFNFHALNPGIEQIFEFSEDDDVSLASSDDDFEEEEEEENDSPTLFESKRGVDEDFSIKGSFKQGENDHLMHRRRQIISGSWSEFTSGKNVVKLWDSLGFSLNFDEDLINKDFENIVSTWEFDQAQHRSAVLKMWPVVLTAEMNVKGGGVLLNGYDSRMPRGAPALFAEWQLPVAEVDGGAAGRVGDFTRVVTVGDVRKCY